MYIDQQPPMIYPTWNAITSFEQAARNVLSLRPVKNTEEGLFVCLINFLHDIFQVKTTICITGNGFIDIPVEPFNKTYPLCCTLQFLFRIKRYNDSIETCSCGLFTVVDIFPFMLYNKYTWMELVKIIETNLT